jgi:hypothetical protein
MDKILQEVQKAKGNLSNNSISDEKDEITADQTAKTETKIGSKSKKRTSKNLEEEENQSTEEEPLSDIDRLMKEVKQVKGGKK